MRDTTIEGIEVERALAQAEALFQVGRYDDVARLAGQAIAADPESVQPRCLLAHALLNMGKLRPALRAADEAVALAPEYEWPHCLRGHILLRMNQPHKAVEAAREAVRLAPWSTDALYVLVWAETTAHKLKEARQTAERLRQAAPDMAMSHEAFGLVAMEGKQWKEAEEHFRRGLELDPSSWSLVNNLGVVLQRQGKNKEAIERFHDAARLDPAEEVSRKNLSQAVSTYAGGGAFATYLLVQIFSAIVRQLPHKDRGTFFLALFPFLLLLIGAAFVGWVWWKRRRLADLHPTVTAFCEAEARRTQRQQLRELPTTVGLTAGILWTVVTTALWLGGGWKQAGLNSVWGLVYVLIAAATITTMGLRIRRWWVARRQEE